MENKDLIYLMFRKAISNITRHLRGSVDILIWRSSVSPTR